MKRLYKSKDNKVFCGVIGGVGEYFEIDPVLLRVVWLLIVVFTGFIPGIIAYFIACMIVPKKTV
ncbi:MAG: PspC domain-containing protein [Candidatus Staskawiczbacteria bacterium]|nr:PspC domain-containing protein [Candidatus Staskawiczbacteria bacterium]